MALGKFWKSTGGNFAMMFSIALVPIILGLGVGLDYSRMLRAKSHLQDVADAASLSLAAASLDNDDKIEEQAQNFVDANFDATILDSVKVEKIMHKDDTYDVTLKGEVPAYFMKIANFNEMGVDVSSMAVRGVTGSVEVALVLDNTTSMGEKDSSGTEKIAALRTAAKDLATTLHEDPDAVVKVAVVPYADYVNVGISNRNQSWISVGADKTTTSGPPDNCGVKITRDRPTCNLYAQKTCVSDRDGKVTVSSCNDYSNCLEPGPTITETVDGPSCTVSTITTSWFGCVRSRPSGTLRLSDDSPSMPYPGFLERSRHCPTPILPLTTQLGPINDAIQDMKAGGGYNANTYIPAGLVWGLNVLSRTQPFAEGKAYDLNNKDPRKVVVLMTDGENTMRFTTPNGVHSNMTRVGYQGDQAVYDATQVKQTRDDTLAICRNIKGKNIEIFSVAFAVDSMDSKSLLQSCATDSDHYFDANDSTALKLAFSQIAEALRQVRLAR